MKAPTNDPHIEESTTAPDPCILLLEAHNRTCQLIETLPWFCWLARKRLIQELVDITSAIDEFNQ